METDCRSLWQAALIESLMVLVRVRWWKEIACMETDAGRRVARAAVKVQGCNTGKLGTSGKERRGRIATAIHAYALLPNNGQRI